MCTRPAAALPKGFTIQKNYPRGLDSTPVEMHWLDADRALVLTHKSSVKIALPYANAIPMEPYLTLQASYQKDETGTLSMALDPGFATGSPYVYVYWGTAAAPHGMRISRFTHRENGGGLSSRADFATEKMLWHDTDGWGTTPQVRAGRAIVKRAPGDCVCVRATTNTTAYRAEQPSLTSTSTEADDRHCTTRLRLVSSDLTPLPRARRPCPCPRRGNCSGTMVGP